MEATSITTSEAIPFTATSKTTSRSRLEWVDFARGLAILLVIYRHSLVGLKLYGVDVPQSLYNIQEYFFNFRMPVFFMLSGFFLSKAVHKYSTKKLFRQKASTLLYPYLVWTIILVSMQVFFSRFTNADRSVHDYIYIIAQPRELDHMWYLLALFNTSCIYILIWKFFNNKPVAHFFFAIGLHFFSFFLKDYSLFSDPFYHYIFLLIGVYLSDYLGMLNEKSNKYFLKLLAIVAPLFIAGQYFWLSYRPGNLAFVIPFLLVILVACVFFYCVCRILHNSKFLPIFSTIGRYSLYIYILHIFVISSFRVFSLKVLHVNNIYFLIAGSLLLGIILPILAYRISDKLNMWYLFKWDKSKSS